MIHGAKCISVPPLIMGLNSSIGVPQANQCEKLGYATQINIFKPSFEEKASFWIVVSQKEMRTLSSSLFHSEQV